MYNQFSCLKKMKEIKEQNVNGYHLVFVHGGVCFQCSAGDEHLPAILFSSIQLFYNMSSPQHVVLALSYQLSGFCLL